jgi:hypothetical protein
MRDLALREAEGLCSWVVDLQVQWSQRLCDIHHRTAPAPGIDSCCSRQSAAFRTVRLDVRSAFTIAILLAAFSAFTVEAPGERPLERSSFYRSSASLPVSLPTLRDSAKIFSGTVLRVEHHNSDSSSALATTRIVFRVDEAILDVRRGEAVTIDEWAGLWQSGERYRVGERVLLFLYPPSRLGLTSPVGNHAGRFPVVRGRRVIIKNPTGKPVEPIEIRRIVAAIRQAERK